MPKPKKSTTPVNHPKPPPSGATHWVLEYQNDHGGQRVIAFARPWAEAQAALKLAHSLGINARLRPSTKGDQK